ncbi:response regulator transcription factor [Limnohabitans sp.]|uniref:response regulator transcription factor n=1 Tax=Limnohabitans sp. TaxID=1907725 RepID=UPI00311E405A
MNINSLSPFNTLALLEDDQDFASTLTKGLTESGYLVNHFSTGTECIKYLKKNNFDVCIFDLNLPDISGLEVMQQLKAIERMPPVIFLTSDDTEHTIERILLAGADDYVIKPPSLPVLQARITALLRRAKNNTPPIEQLGSLTIDHVQQQIFLDDQLVNLTAMETALAFALLKRRGEIVSRKMLNEIMGVDDIEIDTRRLDVHISRIRSKLKLSTANGWKLSSIYQRGYRIEQFSGE